jgi:hypothetical protein
MPAIMGVYISALSAAAKTAEGHGAVDPVKGRACSAAQKKPARLRFGSSFL